MGGTTLQVPRPVALSTHLKHTQSYQGTGKTDVSSSTNWKQILLLFIPGTLWGSAFMLNEIILETIPPFTLTAWRNVIAILLMIVILYLVGGRLPRSWRGWLPYFGLGFFNVAFPFVLISWGQLYIDSGLAAILVSTMPLFTIILAHFITADERLTVEKLIGIGLGLVGIVALIGPGALRGLGANIWAQLAILGAALSYALGGIFMRRFLRIRRFTQQTQPQTKSQWTFLVETTTAQFITATLFVLPGSLFFEQPWNLQPSSASLAALVAAAWLLTITPVLIYYYLIDVAGVTFASTVLYLIPINAVFWGALILNEPLTWNAIAALILILTGIAIINGVFGQQKKLPAESR